MKKNNLIKFGFLFLILAAIPFSVNLVQKNQENRSQAAPKDNRLVVASFNIGHANKTSKASAESIAYKIKEMGFDVVGLQEVNESTSLIKKIAEKTSMKYFHTSTSAGNAILGKSNLNSTSYVRLTECGDDSFRAIQKTVLKINNRDVSFYNVHIDFNSSCRKKQTLDLIGVINKDPNPYILVGDFNFGKSGCSVSDGYFKSGHYIVYDSNSGTRCTDMIIISKNRGIRVVSKKTYKTSGVISDHNLVSATLEIN